MDKKMGGGSFKMRSALDKALVVKTARVITHRFGGIPQATKIRDLLKLKGDVVGDNPGSKNKGEITSGILNMAITLVIKRGDFVVCLNPLCPIFPEGEEVAICPNMDEDRCCS